MREYADTATVRLVFPVSLRPLLHARRRREWISVALDGVSTIGHIVGSVGVPLTEVESLAAAGTLLTETWRPTPATSSR